MTGASRGLGAEISRRLASDGWAVAVNFCAGQAAAESVVEAIREDGGVAESFGADVVDEASVAALFAEVERRLGPVLAIVANATGPQPEAGLEELTWRTHLDQLEFFVKSPRCWRRPHCPAGAPTAADGSSASAPTWLTAPRRGCRRTSRPRALRSA